MVFLRKYTSSLNIIFCIIIHIMSLDQHPASDALQHLYRSRWGIHSLIVLAHVQSFNWHSQQVSPHFSLKPKWRDLMQNQKVQTLRRSAVSWNWMWQPLWCYCIFSRKHYKTKQQREESSIQGEQGRITSFTLCIFYFDLDLFV